MEAVISQLLDDSRDLSQQDVQGQRILVRADLNLPRSPDGFGFSDTTRLDAALPTLRLLSERGARVIVASHLGQPEPGVEPEEQMRAKYSLRPVSELLKQALGPAFVGMADDCVGRSAQRLIASLRDGQVRERGGGRPLPEGPPVVFLFFARALSDGNQCD